MPFLLAKSFAPEKRGLLPFFVQDLHRTISFVSCFTLNKFINLPCWLGGKGGTVSDDVIIGKVLAIDCA